LATKVELPLFLRFGWAGLMQYLICRWGTSWAQAANAYIQVCYYLHDFIGLWRLGELSLYLFLPTLCGWDLDKPFPVGLLVLLPLQSSSFGWFGASVRCILNLD
jgi:hypothetical protein